MVDVGGKEVTQRIARAGGRITMGAATLAMIRDGSAKKGDVLGVARDRRDPGGETNVRPDSRSRTR